ncbi:Uncharacterized protein AC499_0961 [Pseudomonas amygdali pv. lachrymans]|nr:Uncharacterized protein AC499_0961 [Pseudomonas amygdali pv. lachrymans]
MIREQSRSIVMRIRQAQRANLRMKEGVAMEVFQLTTAYNELRTAIAVLNASFSRPGSDNGSAFVATKDGPFLYAESAIALAKRAFEDIFYDWGKQQGIETLQPEGSSSDHAIKRPEKDGRETQVWLGGIGVDQFQLELAKEVNRCKDRFQEAVHNLRQRVQQENNGGENHAYKTFRKILNDNRLGLVSLRQAYRHIPLLDETPASIRFSFSAGGRSIKRMTIGQAKELLVKKGWEGKNIEVAFAKLNNQKTGHVVAQVQELAGYFKANIAWPEPDEGEVRRQTIPVFLPILYLANSEITPSHQPHPPTTSQTRTKPRSDRKLVSEPFIQGLRLYAYADAINPVADSSEGSVDNRIA